MASYRNEQTLKRLYYQEGMTQAEIADKFDVAHQTISHWMNKYDINPGMESTQFKRKEQCSFIVDDAGYERCDAYSHSKGKKEYVKIHRLAAVAWFGIDAVKDSVVHHKDSIPWDNREDNLELMTNKDHMRMHGVNRNLERTVDGKISTWTRTR